MTGTVERPSPGMRILFCTKTNPLNGGVERWLDDLCTGLVARGHEVRLVLADGPRFHRASTYLSSYPRLAEIPHEIALARSGLAAGRRRTLERAIEAAAPDVVVPVLLHEAIGAVGKLKTAGSTVRLVYPLHENAIWAFDAVARNADVIDAVVSVNRLMLDALGDWGGWPEERAFHVPGGVPFADCPTTIWEEAPRLRLGYCGALRQDEKRVLDLVPLMGFLAECAIPFSFTVAGGGPEESALKTALATRGIESCSRFLGTRTRAELYSDFFPRIDVLLITSVSETGPLVAWEAMMHGVLVTTSAYVGLRREGVLRDSENAIVYPVGRPDLGAKALARVVGDKDEMRRRGANARALAEQRLGTERMIDRWENLLNAVCDLPVRWQAGRQCYDMDLSLRDRLEDALRSFLGRPVPAANAHEEWPRYRAGVVAPDAQQEFLGRLAALEDQLVAGQCSGRSMNGFASAGERDE